MNEDAFHPMVGCEVDNYIATIERTGRRDGKEEGGKRTMAWMRDKEELVTLQSS